MIELQCNEPGVGLIAGSRSHHFHTIERIPFSVFQYFRGRPIAAK